MSDLVFYPRLIERQLVEALEDSPVVLIHGPRQCGKTTLAKYVCTPERLKFGSGYLVWGSGYLTWGASRQKRDYQYISFDDPVVRNSARSDPMGFVADLPARVVLDEIQRVPRVVRGYQDSRGPPADTGPVPANGFHQRIARSRTVRVASGTPANRSVASAGAMRTSARGGYPTSTSLGRVSRRLFFDGFSTERFERLGAPLAGKIVAGGYPPALARPEGERTAKWYRNYTETLIQRDVRDLSRVRSLDVLPRLLAVAAARTSQLFNLSDLASPFELSRPTIENYVTLLDRLFLLEKLPPWHGNRMKRQVKRPKLHLTDTGLAAALLGVNAKALMADKALLGQLLETFVPPGIAKTSELVRRAGSLLLFPGQGRRGSGYCHRVWPPRRRRGRGQGGRDGETRRLPWIAQTQKGGRRPLYLWGGAL